MNDAMVRLDQNLTGQSAAPLARVSRDFNAGVSETRNEFAHVHIHTARITNAWLSQRRGVEREHGYTRHRRRKLSVVSELCLNVPQEGP
jgi:hypothetical protein